MTGEAHIWSALPARDTSFPISGANLTRHAGKGSNSQARSAKMVELECLISYAHTIDWRRQKQGQYPEDKSNSRATALLASLEAQVIALNGGPLHESLVKFWEAEGGCCGERDRFNEIVGEVMRAVGFTLFPTTAKELLEEITNRFEEVSDNRQGA